jgi:hypothetical protein
VSWWKSQEHRNSNSHDALNLNQQLTEHRELFSSDTKRSKLDRNHVHIDGRSAERFVRLQHVTENTLGPSQRKEQRCGEARFITAI